MHGEPNLKEIQAQWHGSYGSYLIGFIASLLLTGLAYFLVLTRIASGNALLFTIISLGVAQAIAQLLFFLHIGKESKPYWETLIFSFMVLVLFIVAIGSLWIMFDLNHRMMPEMYESSKEMRHD